MDSEMRGMLTAVLEGQQFLSARIEALSADTNTRMEALSTKIEALSADTNARFEALSTKIETFSADTTARFEYTNAKLDLLTVDMGTVKAQLGDVNERLRYLTHKTAELEQDIFVVKQKQGA